MADVKRAYRSPRRRAQAEATRQEIQAAARRLFTGGGYGATTMQAIAREAGVAVQTVYAAFGSKRAILFALLDQMASDADLGRLEAATRAAADDPRAQLRERIAFTSRFYAQGGDLIEVARTASAVEPDLAAMWREGEARRRRAAAALVADWKRRGLLADGVSEREAADLMWALIGPDVFRLLVVERGWSRRRLEQWQAATLEQALVRPTSPRTSAR
jgi:AcrR family transcriptional regulator